MKYKCDECEAEFYDYEMEPCFDYDFPAGCCPDCGSAELDEVGEGMSMVIHYED